MTLFTMSDLNHPSMTESTYQFHVDTLINELEEHPHQAEVLALMQEQMYDDMNTHYLEE
jgi:hypothetical protein